MKNLAVFFANYPCYDYHLEKDVGLFPVYLKKHYFDSVTLLKVCEKKEDDFLYRGITVRNLFISKKINNKKYKNSLFDQLNELHYAVKYVKEHKEITHIMFFHFHFISNLNFSYKVKKIRPDIKIYDKLDTSDCGAQDIINQLTSSKVSFLKRKYVKAIDYISVETNSPLSLFKGFNLLKDKVFIVPNGIDSDSYSAPDFLKKENLIITVGRLGTNQKNTELLLSILKDVDLKDWKVVLIGGIENQEQDFKKYIDNYFLQNPNLKNKIDFTGNISDKKTLSEYYNKAKVFLFTSRYESFGLSLIEAAFYGDYIISTETGCAKDITDNGKLGFISEHSKEFNQDEKIIKQSMILQLKKIISNEVDISNKYEKQSSFVKENYTMDKVVQMSLFNKFFK